MQRRRPDFLIVGAGLSGLTLAAELSAGLEPCEIVLIDPVGSRVGEPGQAGEPSLDRTLAFWSTEPPPFSASIEHSWSRLSVVGPAGERILELGEHRYHALRWSRLRDSLLAGLRERPGVRFHRGRVDALIERGYGRGPGLGLVAVVDGEPLEVGMAFDSRLPLDRIEAAPGRVLAWQRFGGVRVETEGSSFDPTHAVFMDLRPSTAQRVAFLNVLPESPSSAMVYRVELAAERRGPALQPQLESDLSRWLGLQRWRVRAREQGVLPLSDQRWPRRVGQHVLRIGLAGGRLRPSSGYAFTRIMADNQAIVASLRRHGHPFALPRERTRFRWFDGVLLQLLLHEPGLGPALFEGLLSRCPTPTLLSFLDERVTLAGLFEVMAAMPHKRRIVRAGLSRALGWLRSPGATALPATPERAALRSS